MPKLIAWLKFCFCKVFVHTWKGKKPQITEKMERRIPTTTICTWCWLPISKYEKRRGFYLNTVKGVRHHKCARTMAHLDKYPPTREDAP